MGRYLIDKSGRRYGRLVVLAYAGKSYGGEPQYLCRCDCGREWNVLSKNLNEHGTKSCGCSHLKENRKEQTSDGDDGKFVKISVRKEVAEQFQRLGDEIQAGQSSFIGAMNQREQPEVDLEKELDQWRHKHFNGKRDGDYYSEYLERESELDMARHFYELRNCALEEAARHVYESWMGSTIDDVRRDMVELGRVINARKEE